MSSLWGRSGEGGYVSTGRTMALAGLLIAGGILAPRVRDLSFLLPDGGQEGRLTRVQDTAKRVSTCQRMKVVKEGLRMWAAQHGAPDANDLQTAVGSETATDSWGRRMRFNPPTEDHSGSLRSLGADGVQSADDVVLSVSWSEMNEKRIAPGWR